MRKCVLCDMRTTKAHISLRIRSVAVEASLCLVWSETLEDTFSRDEAQIINSDQKDSSNWEHTHHSVLSHSQSVSL